jgi:hypothetical protein
MIDYDTVIRIRSKLSAGQRPKVVAIDEGVSLWIVYRIKNNQSYKTEHVLERELRRLKGQLGRLKGLYMSASDEWNEKRMDIVGTNGNDGLGYGWCKHDGSHTCPVADDEMVTIETWTLVNPIKKAVDVDWSYVKFYKVEV